MPARRWVAGLAEFRPPAGGAGSMRDEVTGPRVEGMRPDRVRQSRDVMQDTHRKPLVPLGVLVLVAPRVPFSPATGA